MVKFEDVVEILPDDGCWLWHAKLHPSGYGHLRLDGKTLVHAHRAFYEAFVGPIPRGAHVHHKCQVTRCVNPLHLAPISPAEHARLHHAREPVKEAA